jgi:hypothetical protein
MRLAAADLEAFWQAAARPVPVMVVGGGRWGRVWASVLAAARSGGTGIIIVARQNHAETRDWVDAAPALRGIVVAESIASALESEPPPQIAIVASRPRDHVRDALEVLSGGAHVLVEKPIASKAANARLLIEAAARADRLLGVGTEFALLPAFHHLASMTRTRNAENLSASLEWSDPRGETRYGLKKSAHEEITILDDLLPHALSVFRILKPDARFTLADRHLAPASRRGSLKLRDQYGCSYLLTCDAESDCRRRFLQVDTDGARDSVDFSTHPPKILVAGEAVKLPVGILALDSTLRLELGAFLAEAAGLIRTSPLTSGLDEMVALHAALENFSK